VFADLRRGQTRPGLAAVAGELGYLELQPAEFHGTQFSGRLGLGRVEHPFEWHDLVEADAGDAQPPFSFGEGKPADRGADRRLDRLAPALALAQPGEIGVVLLGHVERLGELRPMGVGEDQQVDPALVAGQVGAVARHRKLAAGFLFGPAEQLGLELHPGQVAGGEM
jgi:hypothetical protein